MSFFSRGGQSGTPPPPAGYNRVPDNSNYSLPSGPRGGNRPPAQSMQYNPPPQGYNDPSNALFEKRGYDRRPPSAASRGGGGGGGRCVHCTHEQHEIDHSLSSFGVVGSPSEAFALTNCLAVHPSDFQSGQHVLLNGLFPITVR